MLLILISIIVAALVGAYLLWYASEEGSFIPAILGVVIACGAGSAAVAFAFTSWSWFASEHKAKIINREFNTNYTAEEVYWASDVIDTIREIDRKRVELNGNLMQDQPEEQK